MILKTIQFWAIINDQVSGTRSIEREISLFEKEYGVKVELTEFPWDKIWNYLINSIKENNKSDVVQIGSSWIGILQQIDLLEDITDIIKSKGYKDNIYNIVPETDKNNAIKFAQKTLNSLPTIIYRDKTEKISISKGVSTFPYDGEIFMN